MADELEISREAGARRYVELHREALAVVFSRNGRFIYAVPSGAFPKLSVWRNERVPDLPGASGQDRTSAIEEVDAVDWLARSARLTVTAQTLHQRDGWAMTLLRAVSPDEDEDEDGTEDTYERFVRFSS
jgi:hypothetical protein